jgi:methylthioribose-1-phosphate isomerase
MKLSHSPLFEPVLWQGSGFKILDETALPERIAYIEVRELAQALDAVKAMRTRAFGQVLTFLYSGALTARQFESDDPAGLRDELARMTEQFCAARPTFDFRGLSEIFLQCLAGATKEVKPGAWLSSRVRARAAEIVRAREQRARRAASVLPHPARVLTHCNVSGELVAVAQFCRNIGKEFSVVATETRPYFQGARLTAWELSEAGVPVSLIPDCAVAQVMARGEVNAVVVGSDRCAQNGDIINKVGTYPIALMAKEYGIPFYALAQAPRSLARGADVAIEERPGRELLEARARALLGPSANRLAVRYPAFDVTPAALITNLIGFDDLFTPESFRKKFLSSSSGAAAENSSGRQQYLLIAGMPDDEGYAYLAQALGPERARTILVPEMRPTLRGIGIARELLVRELPTTLISDSMMGTFFARREIQKVCLFSSEREEEGPRAPCGALLTVRLARAHDVAVEFRPSEARAVSAVDADVSTFFGQRIPPPGIAIQPLRSEVIPWSLLNRGGGGA